METLLVMRHAKSDWEADHARDFDRPLNDRGRRSAELMGRLLTSLSLAPGLVITSPAVRALSTARLASAAGGWQSPIHSDESFYEGSISGVIDVVESNSEPAVVMIVGHQPTWSGVVRRLTDRSVEMRTATVAVIRRASSSSTEQRPWGSLERVINPRDHFGSDWDES